MDLHKKVGPAILTKLGPPLVRAVGATWRVRLAGPGHEAEASGKAILYCFWHCDLLIPMYAYRGSGTVVLVSAHRDGQMLRTILAKLGFNCVVGSITRGGAMALRGLLSSAKQGLRLCVPPDGPKGPPRKAKKGVVYLASRSGLAVIPAAVAVSSCWRLRSWDKMIIPRPFAKVVLYRARPLQVPPKIDGDALDAWTLTLENSIIDAQRAAEAELHPSNHREAESIVHKIPPATERREVY